MPYNKICPLTHHVEKGAYDQEITDFDYCKEKRCAWWDSALNSCAISKIADQIYNIFHFKQDSS